MFIHLKFLKTNKNNQPDSSTYQGRNQMLWWGSLVPTTAEVCFFMGPHSFFPFSAHFLFTCNITGAISPEIFWFIVWNKQDPQKQQRFSADGCFRGHFFSSASQVCFSPFSWLCKLSLKCRLRMSGWILLFKWYGVVHEQPLDCMIPWAPPTEVGSRVCRDSPSTMAVNGKDPSPWGLTQWHSY